MKKNMMQKKKKIKYKHVGAAVSAILLIVFLAVLPGVAETAEGERILWISSRDLLSPLTEGYFSGMKEIFRDENIQLDMEVLDGGGAATDGLSSGVAEKLSGKNPYSLVFVTDDKSAAVVRENYEEVFAGIPVFFAGIDNPEFYPELKAEKNFYGIPSMKNLAGTVSCIGKLQPSVEKIILVSGGGSADVFGEEAVSYFAGLGKYDTEIISFGEISYADFCRKLDGAEPKKEVFLLLSSAGGRGAFDLDFKKFINLVSSNTSVPVYTLEQPGIGGGLAGGVVSDKREEGVLLAGAAVSYFQGGNPADFFRNGKIVPKAIFDYGVLEKFSLDYKELPSETVLVNRPVSFSAVDRKIVIGSLTGFFLAGSVFLVFFGHNRKKLDKEAKDRASLDSMTGLPNKNYLFENFDEIMRKTKEKRLRSAFIFIDMDNFKFYNEYYGYHEGDRLLIETANRLKKHCPASCRLFRFDSDEFLIFCENVTEMEVMNLSRAFEELILKPQQIARAKVSIRASIGIAIYPDHGLDLGSLASNAYLAVSESKEGFKSKYTVFDNAIREKFLEETDLVHDLERALKKRELYLVYQPVVDISLRRPVAAEALLRWRHPEKGVISPGVFIPLAEKYGYIKEIGIFVLCEACEELGKLRKAGISDIKISVNVSNKQLDDSYFVACLERFIIKYDMDPTMLKLEITETAVQTDARKKKDILRKIEELGVKLSIDDFGTGVSSMGELVAVNADELKIERSFVKDIDKNRKNRIVVNSIIKMAHNMRINIVAEGVETYEELDFLREAGCRMVQGFLFARPMPRKEFLEYIGDFSYPEEEADSAGAAEVV